MKRALCLVLIVLWAATAAGALEYSLENDRNAVFVFVVLSSAEAEEAEAVRPLLTEYRDRLQYIPPLGAKPLDLPEEGGAILGYFDEQARPEHLLAMRTIPSDPPPVITVDDRHLLRDPDGELATVPPWGTPRHEAPVRIDNRYVEWTDKKDLLVLSEHRRPRAFSREGEEPSLRIDIEDSLLWKQGGTQLERLKALLFGDTLYLMGTVTREISPKLSVRLYVYEDRAAGARNRALVEIPMELPSGPVLLWIQGRTEPLIVGDYARGNYLFETRIQGHRIPEELRPEELDWDAQERWEQDPAEHERAPVALDLATGLRDAELYEEFRHGTLFLQMVPRFQATR